MARILLGGNLIFAGISHLTYARQAFRAQVPDWVPLPKDDTVLYSGLAEIALGSCLALPIKNIRRPSDRLRPVFSSLFFRVIFSSTQTIEVLSGWTPIEKGLCACCFSRFWSTGL